MPNEEKASADVFKTFNEEIAWKIQMFRENIGLTREKFANFTQISASTLTNYENGRQRIPAAYLRILFTRWPHFTMWFITGLKTDEIPNQREPDLLKANTDDLGQYI